MMTLVWWNIKQRKWFIFWWCLGIIFAVAINVLLYPSFRDQAAEYNKALSQLPDAAKALISDSPDFASPVGFLSSQVFYLMLPMLFSIMLIALGASLIAREEHEGTIELILSRPISRANYLSAKILVFSVVSIVVGVIVGVATLICTSVVNMGVSSTGIALAMLLSLVFSIISGLVAFCLTAVGKGARSASIGIASFVAIGGYLIASLASTVKWLKNPAKAFPFNYYHPSDILNGNLNLNDIWFFVVIILVLIGLSYVGFIKRDING